MFFLVALVEFSSLKMSLVVFCCFLGVFWECLKNESVPKPSIIILLKKRKNMALTSLFSLFSSDVFMRLYEPLLFLLSLQISYHLHEIIIFTNFLLS